MRYDDHSWVRKSGDVYEVGVTKQSAEQSETFVFAQLPEQGTHLTKGDTYVTLESAKSTEQIPSPISGTIEAVNMDVFDDPSTINDDPENAWIVKLRLDDPDEFEALSETA